MSFAWSDTVLFTRRQVSDLTGIGDGILGFWIKNGLLVSVAGGAGRGSHRKFAPIQVTFAAILGELQQFGLNIASLRSFADLLQRGAALCEGVALHPFSIRRAAQLILYIGRIREGKPVCAYRYYRSEKTKSGWDLENIPNATEKDLVEELMHEMVEYDPPELILEFSKRLSPEDYEIIEIYTDIRLEMDACDIADFAWLLWQDEQGEWRVAHQTEPDSQFVGHPDVETAIFLAVGKVTRRIWNLDLEERKRARKLRARAELRRRDPDLAARLSASN